LEAPILKDPNQYPTEDVIFSSIGSAKKLWISFFDDIYQNHPDFSEEWRYYKDGNNWLMKVVRKSKTVFWLSVWENTFRITLYFTDKFEEAINKSDISDELKTQFKEGKHYGKIRALSIVFKNPADIEYAKSIIAIKLRK